MRIKDLTGQRFGNLTAMQIDSVQNGYAYWFCRCDCGNIKLVRGTRLTEGHVTSCGCRKGNIKHRESKTRLYHIWSGMRERCGNPNHPQYESYGARGIQVCPEWNDWETFRNWALENGYTKDLSIDRIDNDKGYSPDNCRWATATAQANNTRRTHLVTYNGETHSVSEWARILNIKQSTLSNRLTQYGWSVEKALGKAVKKRVS